MRRGCGTLQYLVEQAPDEFSDKRHWVQPVWIEEVCGTVPSTERTLTPQLNFIHFGASINATKRKYYEPMRAREMHRLSLRVEFLQRRTRRSCTTERMPSWRKLFRSWKKVHMRTAMINRSWKTYSKSRYFTLFWGTVAGTGLSSTSSEPIWRIVSTTLESTYWLFAWTLKL